MNIFYLDKDPVKAARDQCDKHVVKMCLETGQLISNAARHFWGDRLELYRPTHLNHPCTKWACESLENFAWLTCHFRGLCSEYTERFSKGKVKIHKAERILNLVLAEAALGKGIDVQEMSSLHSPPPQVMPEKYRGEDPVAAYRNYYKGDKARFAKWRYSESPKWWKEEL